MINNNNNNNNIGYDYRSFMKNDAKIPNPNEDAGEEPHVSQSKVVMF